MNRSLPIYRCPRVSPFTIDGRLDKRVWRTVPTVNLVPSTGESQRLQTTTVAACWSETHLYVGFHCVDSAIRSHYVERDEPLYDEDVVEVFVTPDGDLHRYYELEFSPLATIFDAVVANRDLSGHTFEADTAWDCEGLACAVQLARESDGDGRRDLWWSAEIAIPFAGLRVSAPNVGDQWRANFYRIDYTEPAEFSAWSPTLVTPARYHEPTRFGWLAFDGEPVGA